eukprot:4826790-Alexandrium_andersonii.AAC.1
MVANTCLITSLVFPFSVCVCEALEGMQKVINSVKRLVPKIHSNPELIKKAKDMVNNMQNGVMKE